MGVFTQLKKMIGLAVPSDSSEDCPSIVLLLNQPQELDADRALAIASSAWGAAGPVELIGTNPPYTYAIRASELFFAIHAVPHRYQASPPISSQIQERCWTQHKAWLSVDMQRAAVTELRASGRLGEAYFTLLHFVHERWSPDCVALYYPAEGVTIPNQGDMAESIRWARRHGTDLNFLNRR
jgi:hypothetical protein